MSKDGQPEEGVARWKELAAEALAAAAEMTDAEAKSVMLDIAERYERLARHAEARSGRKEPK